MEKIRLSVCIPTYNFGKFIGQTLTSIIEQATEEVEIVVLDGASTDNTAEVVRSFQNKFPRLTYHCCETKGGIDKDLAATVDLAKGDYCWLMSSDDVLKPGAIKRILKEIELGCDIYLCNRTVCDLDLNPIDNGSWLSREIEDRIYDLSNKSELINYFNASQSIGALFSYISSIIVSHKKWNEATYDDALIGTNYAHVLRLFAIRNNCDLKYIKEPLVLCRFGNDSFAQQGDVKRFLIDLDGYLALANKLFSDDNETKEAFLRVMKREHPWYRIIKIRAFANDDLSWKSIRDKLLEFHFDKKIVNLASVVGRLKFLVFATLFVKRKIR